MRGGALQAAVPNKRGHRERVVGLADQAIAQTKPALPSGLIDRENRDQVESRLSLSPLR
jgi:hypothetical protein